MNHARFNVAANLFVGRINGRPYLYWSKKYINTNAEWNYYRFWLDNLSLISSHFSDLFYIPTTLIIMYHILIPWNVDISISTWLVLRYFVVVFKTNDEVCTDGERWISWMNNSPYWYQMIFLRYRYVKQCRSSYLKYKWKSNNRPFKINLIPCCLLAWS